ncbi:MAG: hypothetical protein VW339_11280 [Quisquiliibacterium sp.]
MSAELSSAQVATLLRELLSAIRPLRLADRRGWVQVAVGPVRFESDGIELVFFSDSATLDHLVSIQMPDGARAGFADWLTADGNNPVDLLDDSERHELEQRLLEAV